MPRKSSRKTNRKPCSNVKKRSCKLRKNCTYKKSRGCRRKRSPSRMSKYEKAYKLGVKHDVRKDLYNSLQNFDMNSLKEFHNSHISNGNRVIMVLGSKENLDLVALKEYGEIKHLNLEDVFGY